MTTQLSPFECTKGKRHLRLHSSFSDDYMWRSDLSLLLFLLLRTPENTSRRDSHRRWLFLHRRRLCFVAFVDATLVVVPGIIFIGKYNLWFLKFFWHWKVENIFAKNVREMTLLKSVVRTRRHNYGGKWNLYNR